MKIPELTEVVKHFFQSHAGDYGLRAEGVRATYVLNWGGFVNHSFTITDGSRVYHLKLTEKEWSLVRLRRWWTLHRLLEERYHAPHTIAWIELPATGHAGMLFSHIDGQMLNLAAKPELLADICVCLTQLHQDRELAALLAGEDGEPACADCFVSTYIERFRGDLDFEEDERPDFVAPETLQWMHEEMRHLEQMARASHAFAAPANKPIHGDLWANNILVTASNGWYILDWDDFALGDPALDYLLLLWPLVRHQDTVDWPQYPVPVQDAAFVERLELYRRAALLDNVIDVLADYMEAEQSPEHQEVVRAQKRREHLEALALYQQRYDTKR